ncbi:MAG TPA: sodium transporter, partial [Rhodothermales bacterium]|nr:sodium transporter [Rhodothermales bacterium]
MPDFALSTLDLAVILVYVVGIVLLGVWVGRKQDSTDDYFLAGRSLGWGVIGLSLFASNMSTSSLVGMAGEAYGGVGVAVYNYEWMAGIVLVIFCAFFLPFYIKTGVYTMPEFLERRFDGRSRLYFSGWTVFLNITVDTASALYAGSLVVALLYPDLPIEVSIYSLAILAGLYTILGGLKAV